MTKFHCLVAFTSRDIGQYVYMYITIFEGLSMKQITQIFLEKKIFFRKRATYAAMQSGIRITFRRTEWGRFDHPCKKAPNKSKQVQKPRKGNTTAPMTTSSMLQICTQFHYFKYYFGNSS